MPRNPTEASLSDSVFERTRVWGTPTCEARSALRQSLYLVCKMGLITDPTPHPGGQIK